MISLVNRAQSGNTASPSDGEQLKEKSLHEKIDDLTKLVKNIKHEEYVESDGLSAGIPRSAHPMNWDFGSE